MKNIIQLKTDFLIIGGGFAGLWAAKRAWECGIKDILIVDKGPRDWGGLGSMCGGDISVVHPNANLEDWIDDLVYYYDGLCDLPSLRSILGITFDRIRDYEKMGHIFNKVSDGSYEQIPQRGLPHVTTTMSAPKGGFNMRRELVQSLEETEVRRLGNIMITDLVKKNDHVCGAVGFHSRSGTPVSIRARAVLFSSGSGGWKTSYSHNSLASGVFEMALNAGVNLRNMEFIQVWNTPKRFSWEGQTFLLPFGACFRNGQGEDFMGRYSKKYGAKGDPHYNVRGMALEVLAGRGPIYFDTSGISSEHVKRLRPKEGWMKLNDERLISIGIDFFGSKTEWTAQPLISYGGIPCDESGMTNIEGVFAAGLSRSIGGGVYVGGLNMACCASSGYLAGQGAAAYISGTSSGNFSEYDAQAILTSRMEKLGKDGIHPKDVIRRLQEIIAPINVCILKTEKGLLNALDQLAELKKTVLPLMTAKDPHYLLKMTEAKGMVVMTECFLRSSLARTESRCGHFRADYPQRDNTCPVYYIMVNKDDKGISTSRCTLPETPKNEKHGYYMDNFNFPDINPDNYM